MLSERARRALLADLVAAADSFLAGLKVNDIAAVANALTAAATARTDLNDGYVCEMSERFDEVERRMQAVATGSPADAELTALRDAVDKARGQVVGAVAAGSGSRIVYFGGGVRALSNGSPPRRSFDIDAEILCDRFGVRLVAALLRVMAGVNRIAALLHFIKLNSQHVSADSVAYERNFQFAAMQTFAYLKELTRVLGELSAAGIQGALTDPAPWFELQELQRYWERGTRSKVRDEVMFHLGFRPETETTLTKVVAEGERLPIFEADPDPTQFHVRFTAGESLVMTASGLQLSDFREIVTEGVDAYGPLFRSVVRITDDLLRQCGARLPNLVVHESGFL